MQDNARFMIFRGSARRDETRLVSAGLGIAGRDEAWLGFAKQDKVYDFPRQSVARQRSTAQDVASPGSARQGNVMFFPRWGSTAQHTARLGAAWHGSARQRKGL